MLQFLTKTILKLIRWDGWERGKGGRGELPACRTLIPLSLLSVFLITKYYATLQNSPGSLNLEKAVTPVHLPPF